MKIIITFIAAGLLFISCDNTNRNQNAKESDLQKPVSISDLKEFETGFTADSAAKQFEEPEQKDEPVKTAKEQKVVIPDWDKKIIKNATINIEVKNYEKTYAGLRQKITSLGGYVAQEEQSQTDYKIENTILIKVPVDQFDNALLQFIVGAEKVNERRITSQDVTTEFVDTKSRMESKKQVRLRYLDLLKQAKNMEEILSVQSEINSIQEEIESAAGRIEYLGHSASYSTINLTCYQIINESAKDSEKKPFGYKIKEAFSNGAAWIGDLFIGLLSIWPLFLVALIAWVVYKRLRTSSVKKS
ncbi:MAG: DUF4349 domain-containing protein [Chitinophagaceae bacterium]|nr:DUF4349 domain-containing protein [Chitinophagaceae bacterium]